MENDKQNKLFKMLKNMSDYSIQQPKVIEDLCNELMISPAYAPALDLMVEAFLTVHSFALLMFEGLISNASAILRILIEQVAAVTVICRNPKAMNEFLKFQTWKRQYFSTVGEEHLRIRNFLFKKSGYKAKKESALKDYLDYGWIRIINNDKTERGDKLIIKEACLEEVITDINEQLNAFAHGQRSIFSFIQNKDLTDKHISRIIMISGKLFLFLCSAKHELLVNESMSNDKYFVSYINAKIIYLDLNSRAVNNRIFDIIKTTDNLDRDIIYSISTLDHSRGLMYQAELSSFQTTVVARAYILQLVNLLYMICYKLFGGTKGFTFDGVGNLHDFVKRIDIEKIQNLYKCVEHSIPLEKLFEMAALIDDKWKPVRRSGNFEELDEIFITDFTSLIHSLFNFVYSNFDTAELLKSFIPID